MKYVKEYNKKPLILVFTFVLILAAMLVLVLKNTNQETIDITTPTTAPVLEVVETTVPVEESKQTLENGKVTTPYGDLYYPTEWAEYLVIRVEEVPYTVRFCAKIQDQDEMPLFDIHFDTDEGEMLGLLVAEDGTPTMVSITFHPFVADDSWDTEELAIFQSMQEAVNYLIQNLVMEDSVSGAQESITVSTPYGILFYPGKWQSCIRVEHLTGDPYIVEFYGLAENGVEMHLFAVSFGTEEEGSICAVKAEDGTERYVNIHFVELEFPADWSESVQQEMLAMQEGINYLIENLPAA